MRDSSIVELKVRNSLPFFLYNIHVNCVCEYRDVPNLVTERGRGLDILIAR